MVSTVVGGAACHSGINKQIVKYQPAARFLQLGTQAKNNPLSSQNQQVHSVCIPKKEKKTINLGAAAADWQKITSGRDDLTISG